MDWTHEAQEAFNNIRNALCQNAVLYVPLPHQPFCLYTDAFDRGLGAMLIQETPSGKQPVFFLSRKLSKPERNYAMIERKALAIRWAVDHFKYYLCGHQFMVMNDHTPLQWLN